MNWSGATNTSLERYVQGTEQVLENLGRELSAIADRISRRGMWSCLLLLLREAKKLTPVKTGNLVNSYSIYVINEGNTVVGYLVNSASYALFVHEMPEFSLVTGAYVQWSKPGTGSKFVERPLKANERKFLNILYNTAKIRR